MVIMLDTKERVMLKYIAEHRPRRTTFVKEYAAHSGLHRDDVKRMVDLLLRYRVVSWAWDGIRQASKAYFVEWDEKAVAAGEVVVRA